MTFTLQVTGLREFLAASDAAGKVTKKLVRDDLRRAAEPVREEAVRQLHELNPQTKQRFGITIRRVGTVSVEGRARKTTGQRPDWGRTQMRDALEPALEDKHDELERRLAETATLTFGRLFERRL